MRKLNLPNVDLMRVEDLEALDPAFASTKSDRTAAEYCWTATPCLTLQVLETLSDGDSVTYLDADLMFFSNPEGLFEEIGESSICITPHRFADEHLHQRVNGIYCVQWVTFRNDTNGLEAVRWWRDRCIEWCYYRLEDGKLGDQKYLDDWPVRFEGVCELSHPGGGLAPWNISRYRLNETDSQVMVDDVPLVFFHYHRYALRRRGADAWQPPGYKISSHEYELVYKPYTKAIAGAKRLVKSVDPTFDGGLEPSPSLRSRAHHFREVLANWSAAKAPCLIELRRR